MGKGECRNDFQDVSKRLAKFSYPYPASGAVGENCRQQQGTEKKDVIEAGPNVPDAFVEIIEERMDPADGASLQAPGFLMRTQDGRMGLAVGLQTQQPAMLRIEIEEEIVADLKNLRRAGAIGRKPQPLVGAVGVVIGEMLDHSRGTGLAVRLQCQMGKQ